MVHLWVMGVTLPGFVLELAMKTPLFLTTSTTDVITELRMGLGNAEEECKEERRKFSRY